MTVNVYSGPGPGIYESTTYTVAVGSIGTSHVYAITANATHESDDWDLGDPVELSWVKFTADETVTVRIGFVAAVDITEADVYPATLTHSISGGVLSIQVPTNTRVVVRNINGDGTKPLVILANPLPRAIGTTTAYTTLPKTVNNITTAGDNVTMTAAHGWSAGQRVVMNTTGTLPTVVGDALSEHEPLYVINPSGLNLQLARTEGGAAIDFTSNGTGTITLTRADWTSGALSFGAGVHTIGRMFKPASGTRIVLEPNAVVIGSFDLRGTNGISIEGQGTLLGEFATHAFVYGGTLTDFYDDQLPYCMFLGYDGVQQHWDNEVQGITVANFPFFANFEGVCEWTNAHFLNPWYYGTTGPKMSGQSSAYPVGQTVDCFAWIGDDCILLGEQIASIFAIVSGCFLATSANSVLHCGYWSGPDANTIAFVSNCELMHNGVADNGRGSTAFPLFGGNTIVKCWTDGYDGEETYGRFDVAIQGCRVWGPVRSRFLHAGNFAYPFTFYGDEARDRKGQAAKFLVTDIEFQHAPEQLSVLQGLDWTNTPHNWDFRGIDFAGEPLRARNWETFFEPNGPYPYFITVEGQPVVTAVELCNRALAYIGESPFLTSIDPPDDNKVAKACAKLYSQAFNEVVQGHEWGFATKRAALVEVANAGNDTYRYCYAIPAGMLTALEVMPKGAQDGYRDTNGYKVRHRIEVGTNTQPRIWTNLADAWLRYTVYVTNPNELDPAAQEAVVLTLAAKLVAYIVGGEKGQEQMRAYLQLAQGFIARARALDGNQRSLTPEPATPWVGGREG